MFSNKSLATLSENFIKIKLPVKFKGSILKLKLHRFI